MDDPREAGRVGPCWDDAARELLHVGDDRWLGVGCDVEGAQRWGESPECTLLRKRITACLRRDRQPWVLPPTDYARPRKLYYHGGKDCGGHPEPVERWTDGPII